MPRRTPGPGGTGTPSPSSPGTPAAGTAAENRAASAPPRRRSRGWGCQPAGWRRWEGSPSPRSRRGHTAAPHGHPWALGWPDTPLLAPSRSVRRGRKGLNHESLRALETLRASPGPPLPPPPHREGPRAAAPRGAAVTGGAPPALLPGGPRASRPGLPPCPPHPAPRPGAPLHPAGRSGVAECGTPARGVGDDPHGGRGARRDVMVGRP